MTNSWTETALGEVIELYDHERIPLSTQQRSQRQGGYPYYGASGIIDYIDDYIFDGRFLLISEDGANLVERNTPIAFFATGKFWVNNHSHVVRGIPEVADDYFLMSYIQSANISGYITGTAQPKLSQRNLKAIRLPLPPFPIQRKIAAVLSAYDDLIENNTRRIEILEEMARTIYREWFVEFRFPGHEQVKVVESELGLIPQGWEVVKISDIVDLSRKGIIPSKFPEEIFAHFSIPAFDSGCMPAFDSSNTIKSNKYLITENCVLVSKLNPNIPRVWFPFLNIEHRAIASTEFLILIPKPPVDCVFLFNLFRSTEFSGKLAVRALGTSRSHQRVSPTDFLNLSVLIPTESLLNSFHEKVSSVMNICNTLRSKNVNLRQTRDLLLPKLISGEIDVSDLKIDTNGIQPRKGGTHIPDFLKDRLHSDENILGGKPVIKSTRLAVAFILELLGQGWSEEQVLENYPSIGHEDIAACLAYQQKVTDASVSG